MTPPQNNHQRLLTKSRSLATSSASTPVSDFPASLPPGYELQSISQPSTPSSPPFAVFKRPLEVSALDDRSYRLVTLPNGLEALLVHDPKTDKASAALDVRVGHLSDPPELQGLAHFCEHLLFMGTDKYPKENEYSEYLSQHSGSSNAYTGMDNTNYFFDVGHEHLEGALDRFAQFFIAPLFDPSCTEREIRAVDSEHKKNLQSDMWRAFQLEKTLSDPQHPYSNFGTGSLQTLWDEPRKRGSDVRDELLKFHDRYYSANIMKLVVLGREPLDVLTQWVTDKFSPVKNKNIVAPSFPRSPLTDKELQTQVFFRSVKDIRALHIAFPFPDQGPLFRTKPGQYLSHLIGHEGEGSILSYLKKKGWSNHISAGASNGADGFEFFKVSVDLTQEGLKNYESVVAAVFKYIELIKTTGIAEWSFREVQQLWDLAFRFKEKSPPSSYTSNLSSQMQQPFPRESILSGPYFIRDFDLPLIQSSLDWLSPERCRVFVAAQTLPDGSKEWDSKEKWYGTEYKQVSLPQIQVKASEQDFEDLALPKPNTFIPSDLEVKEKKAVDDPLKRPTLLRHTPLSRLWHKKDDRFWVPKANVFFLLRSPLIDATPNNAVKSRLFTELIKDALTEYSYDAELAGLGYNIDCEADSIGVSVEGYNDKLPVLLKYIFERLAGFTVDPKRFEILKDLVRRGYQNFRLDAPYQHANYYTTYLTQERMWTPQEKLVELEQMQAEDIQKFIPELLGRLHLEVLAHGNLLKEDSIRLVELAEGILKSKPLTAAELISHRSLMLPRGKSFSWSLDVPNPENLNSSIEYFVQVGDPMNLEDRAKLALLSQIVQEPCFDQLRTKEQLGYLVFSSSRSSIGMQGFRILVQSERDSRYVESRIDAFLNSFKNHLETISDAEFEAQKMSLINKKLEAVKNLYEESSRFWYHIHSGYFDFLQRETDVANVRNLTKKDVLDFYLLYVHHSSPTRAKLTVHMRSQIKAPRFSKAAVDALADAVKSYGIDLTEAELEQLKTAEPTAETVKSLVNEALAKVPNVPAAEQSSKLLGLVDKLAAEHPAEEEEIVVVGQDSEVAIEDVGAFKASLIPSKAAVPVIRLSELAERANL